MTQPWHVFIYHLEGLAEHATAELIGTPVISLRLDPEQLRTPFSLTFDRLREKIEAASGGYCEGDGAFGWHPPDNEATHVCGTIHCLDERVMCFELHATLNSASWESLAKMLELDSALAIQFPEWGIFVAPEQFREWLQKQGTID